MRTWDPEDLVKWKGAKLLSRPDMEVRQVKGIETPQRVGRARFAVELDGEHRDIRVGSHYWDDAVEQFGKIEGDRVDVTFLPYPYSVGEKTGIVYFFYEIKES